MITFEVYNIQTGEFVTRYNHTHAIESVGYEFATHEHRPVGAVEASPAAANTTEWLIDIGPFFDRFGPAKMAVLTSTSALVKAILQDVTVRKWVDLKRPDVADAINTIAQEVPDVSPELAFSILNNPVQPDENLALRTIYFKEA